MTTINGHTREDMLREIRRRVSSGDITPAQAAVARSNMERQLRVAREREIQSVVEEEKRLQSGSMARRVASPVVAAGLNLFDTATLGYGPRVLGEDVQTGVAASRRVNPVASTIGSLGGIFAPGGMGRFVGGLGARAATRATGTAGLAANQLGQNLARRGGANILNALVGGTGATTAITLAESREDRAALSERIADAAGRVTSPSALATTVALGGIQTRMQGSVDREFSRLLVEAKRRGIDVSGDVSTGNANVQKALRALAQTPGGSGRIQRFLNRSFYAPMRRWNEDIRARFPGSRATAAAAVRRIAGEEPSQAAPRGVKGSVTQARRGILGSAISSEADDQLTGQEQGVLLNGVRSILLGFKDTPSKGRIGGELRRTIQDVGKTVGMAKKTGGSMTVQDLVNFTDRLQKLSGFKNVLNPNDPNASDANRRAAQQLHAIFRGVIRQRSSSIDEAMESAQRLRRVDEALEQSGVRQTRGLDTALLRRLFGSDNIKQAWTAYTKNATTEEIQAARGWYLGRFFRQVENGASDQRYVNVRSVRRAFEGDRRFNQEEFNFILGDGGKTGREIMDMALISERFMQGVAKAEGSPTAANILIAGAATAGVGAALKLADELVTNPFSLTTASVLGAVGVRAFISSMIDGAIAGTLAATGRRERIPTIGTSIAPYAAARAEERIQSGDVFGVRQ